jgi:hypothetical protein
MTRMQNHDQELSLSIYYVPRARERREPISSWDNAMHPEFDPLENVLLFDTLRIRINARVGQKKNALVAPLATNNGSVKPCIAC